MRQNLIKKPVLGIEMASFCKELKKDIIKARPKAWFGNTKRTALVISTYIYCVKNCFLISLRS